MRIPCPFCGERDSQEFVYRGDARPQRPDPAAVADTVTDVAPERAADVAGAFHDYVYLRENPAGPLAEHWYHAQGCRSWMVVTRDTRTHAILDVAFPHGAGR